MTSKQQLALMLSALALGMFGQAGAGQSATRQCTSEACACEKALRENTVEALEKFLKKYPHSANGKTACAALAVPPGVDAAGKPGLKRDGQSLEATSEPSES